MHATESKKKNSFITILSVKGTLLLIGLNIFVYYWGSRAFSSTDFFSSYALTPYTFFTEHEFWRLFTTGFLHTNLKHLIFNMIGLLAFGSIVEKKLGFFKFAFIYISALIISMGVSLGLYTYVLDQNVMIVGASGAIMGLLSAAMLLAPFEISYELLLPIPVMFKAWLFFYADIKGFLGGETDGISHLAHLVGFFSITVITYFLDTKDKKAIMNGLVINVCTFLVLAYAYMRLSVQGTIFP